MIFSVEEIRLLKDMAVGERNHADRCLNINNILSERQRERDLKRAELLERIIKFAEESDPTPVLITRVFELMGDARRKTLNSVACQIHAENLVKCGKNRVYDIIHRSFDTPISKDGEIVGIEVLADAMGNQIRHLFRIP